MGNKPVEQFCFNCGDTLGFFRHYAGDPPESCGKLECQRELMYFLGAEEDERRMGAEEDDFGRWGK
jgi:hypothetical protein